MGNALGPMGSAMKPVSKLRASTGTRGPRARESTAALVARHFSRDQAQAPRELSKGGHLVTNESLEFVSGKKERCQAQLPAKLAPRSRAGHLFQPIQPLLRARLR